MEKQVTKQNTDDKKASTNSIKIQITNTLKQSFRGLLFCIDQKRTSWILQTKGFIWESSVCVVLPCEDARVTITEKLELRPLALL